MSRESFIKELGRLAGPENVLADPAELLGYSYDAAVLDQVLPAAVVQPTRTEDLGRVVAFCAEEGLAVVPRGSGTNLSGGALPRPGCVVLSTNRLDKIIEINEADMYAVVQPGVVTARLFARAMAQGLFYPPDPGSQAVSTLGGNVAENSGGLRGLKYGVTRDYVMQVDFIDSMGELVKAGSRTVKCATGYNLTGLMVGSEGTLGVFAQITLKLIPPPRDSRAMLATFNSTEEAGNTVAAIIAARILPATLEFLDSFTIRTVEDYSHAGLPTDAAALLLIEVDGHPAQVAEDADRVADICRAQGAVRVRLAADAAERNRIWEARRAAIPALARLRPTLVLEDATVPRSRVPEMVRAVEEISARHGILAGTFGHAGDGNLHPCFLFDKRDRAQWDRVRAAVEELFDKALSLGGTLSGEHGLGLTKARFLPREVGRATVAWSRRMKAALDPKGILNPGKVLWPDDPGAADGRTGA